MVILIQRVNWTRLTIEAKLHSEIGRGLLAFVGLEQGDDLATAQKLIRKLLAYRVFPDADGKMNLSLADIGGDLMLVSQFTLAADTGKGLRPGFSSAMAPELAQPLYNEIVNFARNELGSVHSGVFAADMQIALENDGPVTFLLRA